MGMSIGGIAVGAQSSVFRLFSIDPYRHRHRHRHRHFLNMSHIPSRPTPIYPNAHHTTPHLTPPWPPPARPLLLFVAHIPHRSSLLSLSLTLPDDDHDVAAALLHNELAHHTIITIRLSVLIIAHYRTHSLTHNWLIWFEWSSVTHSLLATRYSLLVPHSTLYTCGAIMRIGQE